MYVEWTHYCCDGDHKAILWRIRREAWLSSYRKRAAVWVIPWACRTKALEELGSSQIKGAAHLRWSHALEREPLRPSKGKAEAERCPQDTPLPLLLAWASTLSRLLEQNVSILLCLVGSKTWGLASINNTEDLPPTYSGYHSVLAKAHKGHAHPGVLSPWLPGPYPDANRYTAQQRTTPLTQGFVM